MLQRLNLIVILISVWFNSSFNVIATAIFDSYFSTKAAGHGLGLSIVYSIIQRHEGHITVDFEENIGARFEFYLSVVQ